MVYKVFGDESEAEEYYWRFWGMHAHEPLARNPTRSGLVPRESKAI